MSSDPFDPTGLSFEATGPSEPSVGAARKANGVHGFTCRIERVGRGRGRHL
jgi:hypothetical protein